MARKTKKMLVEEALMVLRQAAARDPKILAKVRMMVIDIETEQHNLQVQKAAHDFKIET